MPEKFSSAKLAEHRFDLESRLLRPKVRGNSDAICALLAYNFREFGSLGRVFTRTEVLAELAGEAEAQEPRFRLSEFHVDLCGRDVALVTYRAHKGTSIISVKSLRSSVWVYRDGRWQMLFHQGTTADGADIQSIRQTEH